MNPGIHMRDARSSKPNFYAKTNTRSAIDTVAEQEEAVGSTRIPEGSGRAGICRARRNPHQDADAFRTAPIQPPCGKNGAKAGTSAMRKTDSLRLKAREKATSSNL